MPWARTRGRRRRAGGGGSIAGGGTGGLKLGDGSSFAAGLPHCLLDGGRGGKGKISKVRRGRVKPGVVGGGWGWGWDALEKLKSCDLYRQKTCPRE